MSTRRRNVASPGTHRPRRPGRLSMCAVVSSAIGLATAPAVAYTGIAAFAARKLAFPPALPITETPASRGFDFREVAFPSRDDGMLLRGWLIPGVGADGAPTLERTVIALHGAWQNRTDPAIGLLDLCCDLAREGFAVLAFDMRCHGESQRAPFTLGDAERRDVLGAVDYLHEGTLPYPQLARPQWIGGYGISMGANALLYAAASEPTIRAVAADSAYAEMLPTIQRELPLRSKLPRFFTPGILLAARRLFGVNIAAVRPMDAVAAIAPRPLLLIQGGADAMNPASSLTDLVRAAEQNPRAHVTIWRAPNVPHAQAYHREQRSYVSLLVSFYAASYRHVSRETAADAHRRRIAG